MSAYLCSDSHINALAELASLARVSIYSATKAPFDCFMEQQNVAEILKAENTRSVNARYRETDVPEPIRARCEARFLNLSAVQIIKLCNCFDYQACETSDYETTLAAMIVDRLRRHYISRLPGYDAAEWGLHDAPSAPTVARSYRRAA